MRRFALATILIPALVLVVGVLHAQQDDLVSLKLTDATLARALQATGDEAVESAPGTDLPVRIEVRYVPRDRYEAVLAEAVRLATDPTASEESLSLEELAGFERLVIGQRNLLAEAWRAAEERAPAGDGATLDYLHHRRLLAEHTDADTPRVGVGWLGVSLAGKTSKNLDEMAPEIRRIHEAWDGWGAFIREVMPGHPAAASGLMPGDIVVRIDGLWVDSSCTMKRRIAAASPGQEIRIDVLRDGQIWTELAVIGDRADYRTSASPSRSTLQNVVGSVDIQR